jgi:hypothetical protein
MEQFSRSHLNTIEFKIQWNTGEPVAAFGSENQFFY